MGNSNNTSLKKAISLFITGKYYKICYIFMYIYIYICIYDIDDHYNDDISYMVYNNLKYNPSVVREEKNNKIIIIR